MAGATRVASEPTTEVGMLVYQLGIVVAVAISLKRTEGLFPAAARTEAGAADAMALRAEVHVGFAWMAAASAPSLDT